MGKKTMQTVRASRQTALPSQYDAVPHRHQQTGAVDGLGSFPRRWVLPVMACRPARELGAAQPRPMIYWPDDLADLAEALVTARPGV